MSMSKNILTVLMAVILFSTGAVSAVTYTDDFNSYPDANELQAVSPDWELAHGGKNWHIVDNNSLKIKGADPSGADNVVGDCYIGALHAGEGYQRVSIDYMPRNDGNDAYIPQASIHLNFNGMSHYYFAADSYRLSIRGVKDMQVAKLDAAGTEEIASGWHGFTGGDLAIDTWYRLTLEKNGNYIICTVTSLDGQIVHGALHIVDTGVPHTGGYVAITENYGLAGNSCRWDNFEYELLEALPAIDLLYTDDFNRPNGELSGTGGWQLAHGGKNWHLIDNNSLKIRGADPSGADNIVGDVYIGALHTGESYQRVSIDYMPRNDGTIQYIPHVRLHLNFDGREDYYLDENSYRLSVRGIKDMQVAKIGYDPGANDPEEFTSGWHGFAGGDLAIDTWYRLTLEREDTVIKGTVTSQDGQTEYGSYVIIDTNEPHTGGWVAITEVYGIAGNSCRWDNFEYQLYNAPGPFFCNESGTVYMEGDLNEDCYVDLVDVNIAVEQWLNTSDPTDSEFSNPSDTDAAPSMKIPRAAGTITVDGNLNDWSTDLEWTALDKWYFKVGDPNDVVEAKATFCWDADTDKVYAIVVVDETVQSWSVQYYYPDSADSIEIYSQGSGAGGTGWSGEFDVAQQYRAAPDTDVDQSSIWNGGQWYVWGTGEEIDVGVGFECVVDVSGSVTTYELGIPQFDSYEGLSAGGSTVVTQLDVNDVVGLDIIAFTIDDWLNHHGYLAANTMTGKWDDAGQFAQYTLVEELTCGDLGYWSADINGEDCRVNFADYTTLADEWKKCTDPADSNCNQYWLEE